MKEKYIESLNKIKKSLRYYKDNEIHKKAGIEEPVPSLYKINLVSGFPL